MPSEKHPGLEARRPIPDKQQAFFFTSLAPKPGILPLELSWWARRWAGAYARSRAHVPVVEGFLGARVGVLCAAMERRNQAQGRLGLDFNSGSFTYFSCVSFQKHHGPPLRRPIFKLVKQS